MINRGLRAVIALLFFASGEPALAQANWGGQTPISPINGSIGPYYPGIFQTQQITTDCIPGNTPPPCVAGQTPQYNASGTFTTLSSIPAAAGANGSNLGVSVFGVYADPSSPTGLSDFDGAVPLTAFATASSVQSLSTSFNSLSATVNGLSAQVQSLTAGLSQLQQQFQVQDRQLRQGVAMSLAMDGIGSLEPGERFAVSMNVGTFGGQGGVAGSFAFRADNHVTFTGGVGTGMSGGLVGGRAGVRFAW